MERVATFCLPFAVVLFAIQSCGINTTVIKPLKSKTTFKVPEYSIEQAAIDEKAFQEARKKRHTDKCKSIQANGTVLASEEYDFYEDGIVYKRREWILIKNKGQGNLWKVYSNNDGDCLIAYFYGCYNKEDRNVDWGIPDPIIIGKTRADCGHDEYPMLRQAVLRNGALVFYEEKQATGYKGKCILGEKYDRGFKFCGDEDLQSFEHI